MTNKECTLMYIDKAIRALRAARHHVKYDKCNKANTNAKHAFHYMKRAFPCLRPVVKKPKCCRRNICKKYVISNSHNKYIFHFCDCDCHPRPQPINLASHKFFAKVSGGVPSGNDLIIPVSSFVNDQGNSVISFPRTYEYTTLYINGMVQQNGVFSITPTELTIRNGTVLDSDDPVVVELVIEV